MASDISVFTAGRTTVVALELLKYKHYRDVHPRPNRSLSK